MLPEVSSSKQSTKMVDPWQTEKKKKVHTHKKQPHDRNESEDSPNILPKWRKLNSPVTFKLI